MREHNSANQITEQTPALGTIGGSGTPPELPFAYDAAGNLRTQSKEDGGEGAFEHVYTHDAWNRLVKVQRRKISTGATETIQESRYNALHWRVVSEAAIDKVNSPAIVAHAPNQRRVMWYDGSWRLVQEDVFEAPYSGSPPAFSALPAITSAASNDWLDRQCQTIYGIRALDDVVARRVFDRPSSGSWSGITTPETSARGSGAHFYLTDPQGSPLAIIDATGKVTERLSYSAYGAITHSWPADIDDDGLVDNDDKTAFYTWFFTATSASKSIGGSNYNVDYDIALLGAFAPAMLTAYDAAYTPLPPAVIEGELAVLYDHGGKTRNLADNIFGWCGYVYNQATQQYTVRYRDFDPALGRWLQQDPAGFRDSMNLYGYIGGNPIGWLDPLGLDGDPKYQWHHMTPDDAETKKILQDHGIDRDSKELGRYMPDEPGKHRGRTGDHVKWSNTARDKVKELEKAGKLNKENLETALDELAASDEHADWFKDSAKAKENYKKWKEPDTTKHARAKDACEEAAEKSKKAVKEAAGEVAENGVKQAAKKIARKGIGPAIVIWALAEAVFSDKTFAETMADAVLEGTTGLSLEEAKEGFENVAAMATHEAKKERDEAEHRELNRRKEYDKGKQRPIPNRPLAPGYPW